MRLTWSVEDQSWCPPQHGGGCAPPSWPWLHLGGWTWTPLEGGTEESTNCVGTHRNLNDFYINTGATNGCLLTSVGHEDFHCGILQQVSSGKDGPDLREQPFPMESFRVGEYLEDEKKNMVNFWGWGGESVNRKENIEKWAWGGQWRWGERIGQKGRPRAR